MPTIASSSRWQVPENPLSFRLGKTEQRPANLIRRSTSHHLIENFFCKLKQFRGLATRYDKTARNFLAALHLAAATIWLI